jgi:hypothetical protein
MVIPCDFTAVSLISKLGFFVRINIDIRIYKHA